MQVLAGGRVYSFDARTQQFERHDALVVDAAGDVRSLNERDAGAGVRRIELGGATVVPAFADAHVHLTDTGYFLGERDLSTTTSYEEFAEAVARVPNESGVVFGGQYDESRWADGRSADARPLDRFHANARALLSRIDGHSCLVNRATLAWLDLDAETQGVELDAAGTPTGRLTLHANWLAQSRFLAEMPLARRREAERRAVDLALSRGTLHLHAQLYGFERSEYAGEIAALRELPAAVYPKVCEPDPLLARELGLRYVGGDVFLDGSLGSRTAALLHPYADGEGSGALRFTDAALEEYFSTAERLGIGAGVHAIGDAAIEQCIRCWTRVLHGKSSRTGARHFIEHFECATLEHVKACASMGIVLSMQPLFDAQWGGVGGMYERRLGAERMQAMNAFQTIARSGAVLCGGDDAPVCPLDPLAGMQASLEHHEVTERLDAHQTLAAYTVNAAYLACVEGTTGNLAPGLSADFVVLDRDPIADERFEHCIVLETWHRGKAIFKRADG